MELDYTYMDEKKNFDGKMESRKRFGQGDFTRGGDAQATWLYDKGAMQYDERDRLITLLPLIRYEVEHGILTEELHDEVELYYEDYKAGKFDGLLAEEEIGAVEEDLFWSYEHRDDHPISK